MKRGEPSRRSRPAFPLLLTLLSASGIVSIPASTAQEVLEARPGAVRIWDSSARAIDVPLARGRIARDAVSAEGGHLVAGEDPRSLDLFFVLRTGGEVSELPVPPPAGIAERARPVLLTRHERLDGAVWLEDTRSSGLAVLAAEWNGTSWEAVETVAPANGRPQLAPAAAVLADGTWLVVWAGYDGDDDEIFWSRRRDGVWSPPRRLHRDNRVPDLLPAVTADGDEAFAAWSFYDGNDYRVRTARFRGDGWRVNEPLAGLGAEDARWQKSGGRAFVTYRTVLPEAWTAVELAEDGEVLVGVSVETADPRPPIVTAEAGSGPPRLRWPYAPARPAR